MDRCGFDAESWKVQWEIKSTETRARNNAPCMDDGVCSIYFGTSSTSSLPLLPRRERKMLYPIWIVLMYSKRCDVGIKRKLIAWTTGHTFQEAVTPAQRSLSILLLISEKGFFSITPRNVKKHAVKIGAHKI